MGKIITSPVKRWPGKVTLYDPMTLPMVLAVEDADRHLFDELLEEKEEKKKTYLYLREGHTWAEVDDILLPAIFKCVEKWDLANFPEDLTVENFPATPREDSRKLVGWLRIEILNVYRGEVEVPNE